MDPSMIRILCAALAAVLLGVIVLRRRRTKAE
jgi:MYXO-CTERM domain-containing protein